MTTTSRFGRAVVPATLALILTGGLTLSAAPGAAADATISTLSDAGQDAYTPQVAVGPDGTTTAVWYRYDGADFRIQAATRSPGGTWSAAATLSDAGQEAFDAQVSLGPDGTATAVWQRSDGLDYRIQAATRPPGGTWSTADTLSAANQNAGEAQVTIGPDGTATAVWERLDSVNTRVQAATRPPGGTWSLPVTLSEIGEDASNPQVAAAPDGTATAIWYRFDGSHTRVQAATRPPGGSWSDVTDLSEPGREANDPQVTVAPDGTAHAVWRRVDENSYYRIQVATRPPGGTWTTPQDISESGENAVNPQVTAGPGSTVHAVWQRPDGSTNRVQASVRAPGLPWSTPVTLSEAGQAAYDPQIAIGPNGTASATWSRSDGTHARTQTALLPPGGSWTAPVNLSDAGQVAYEPQVAIGTDGTAAIAWYRSDGSNERIQAIVNDKAFALPVVVPDTSKIAGKKVIKKAKAKYKFSSPNAGATFECRVDKKFKKYAGVSKKKAKKQVPWKACTSPYVVKAKKLKNGKHKLYVRAVLGGQVDPTPSVKKLKVKRP